MMSSKLWMSLFLVFTFSVSCLCNPPPWKSVRVERQRDPEEQFMYLRLSLLVSSTIVVTTPALCKQNPKSLTIDGFHPVLAKYSGPHKIDTQALDKVKDDLLKYWTIMKYPQGQFNYAYFQMIYENDGRLCDGMLKGEEYFSKAIELAKLHREKIYEALSLYGTPPSESETYDASDIRKAIRGYTHKQPQITCLEIKGYVFLYEIMICFDKSGEFTNCYHERPDNDCKTKKKIIIPPLEFDRQSSKTGKL